MCETRFTLWEEVRKGGERYDERKEKGERRRERRCAQRGKMREGGNRRDGMGWKGRIIEGRNEGRIGERMRGGRMEETIQQPHQSLMESGGDQKRGHGTAGDGSVPSPLLPCPPRLHHPHTPSLIFILMRPFSAAAGTGTGRRAGLVILLKHFYF